MFDAFRAQIIFKNIASILAPQIALEYHAIRTYLNLLIKIEIKERSGKDKLDKRRRSQFFQSLRNFSNQAKVRSTPPTPGKRKICERHYFRAVLYVLKTGCQWRNLPKDFPNWKLVYYYFTVWKKPKKNRESVLEEILKKISIKNSNCRREEAKTSFVIIDSQSVKNTDTAKEKGYDTGEKISGIKRHIAVDSQGLPHATSVTNADVTDHNGAIELLKINKNNLTDVKNVMADFGYSGENFAREVHKIIGSKVEIVKRNDVHKFSVISKRWVVERTFA